MKNEQILTKKDTAILKGIAILLVMHHNFFHWIKPILGENEFSFKQKVADNFINGLQNNPLNFIKYLSVYLTPFISINLFVFISGYGLCIAYFNKQTSYLEFIKKRLTKLYPVFIISLIGLFFYDYIIFRGSFTLETLYYFFIRITQLANFIPGKLFVLNGPYWFYSLIIQLYLLFPLFIFLQKRNKYNLLILTVISIIIVLTLNDWFLNHKISLLQVFIGYLPVFCFGIYFSLYGKNIITYFKYLTPIFILLFIIGLYNKTFWYLSYISFICIVMHLYLITKKKIRFKKSYLINFLVFTGNISYYLFAVHGFLRKPWVGFANKSNSTMKHYIYFFIFILISYIIALITKKIEHIIITRIKPKK